MDTKEKIAKLNSLFNKDIKYKSSKERNEMISLLKSLKEVEGKGKGNSKRLGAHPNVPKNAFNNSEAAFSNAFMLAFLTFLFQTLFLVASYFTFK